MLFSIMSSIEISCKNGKEKLYFILETMGSDSFLDLRTREQLKIHCGKKCFEALDN